MTPTDRATGAGTVRTWTEQDLESIAVRMRGSVPVTEFGVIVVASDGAFVACTQTAADILGLTVDQVLGRTSIDPRWAAITTDGEPLAGDRHPAMNTLRTRRPQIGVLLGVQRGRDQGGDHTWLRVDSYLLPADPPHPPGAVVSCFTVVDGSRAAELRLAQSERTFRMITERSQEVVGLHALDGTWLWASPAAERVFGRMPRDLFGTSVFDLVHPDEIEIGRAAMAPILDGSDPVTVTIRMIRGDGAVIWVEVIGQLIRDGEGRPHQLQSSFREVTARVEAERSRDDATATVRAVLETSRVATALRGDDGRIRMTNAALRDVLGVTDEQLIGSPLTDLVHADDRGIVTSATDPDRGRPVRLLRFDGSSVRVHHISTPVGDGGTRLDRFDEAGYPPDR